MIKKLFIIIVIVCIIVLILNYFGHIDLNTILPEDIASILPTQEEPTQEEPTKKPTDALDITDKDKQEIEDGLTAMEEALKTRDEISSAMEEWFLKNLGNIITFALVVFELYGMIGDIKDFIDKMKKLYPDGKISKLDQKYNKMKQSMTNNINIKLNNIKAKFKKIKIKKLFIAGDFAMDTRLIISNITDKMNKKTVKMFNNTIDGLKAVGSSIGENIGDIGKVAGFRDAAKAMRKINDGLNTVSDAIKSSKIAQKTADTVATIGKVGGTVGGKAAGAASALMKIGKKALPLAGFAFAAGGAALCFASANAEDGFLENEYKDDPDAVKGANIACGIELAIDIITESMELLVLVYAMKFAFLGPIALGIAILVAAISITGIILDVEDPCGYNRPMEKDETLEEFKKSILASFFTAVIDQIAEVKDTIKNAIKAVIKEQLNEYGFNFSDDDMTKLVSDKEFQKKKFGKSFEEIFGVTFDEMVDEQIATIIEDMKYTKPYEFSGKDASLFKDSDLDKYNSYLNEYYDKCNLIPNPLSLEQRRAYSEARKLRSKQRLFIATLQLENARKLDEISQMQLEQAKGLEQTAAALLNILKDVKDATDAYREGNRKKLNLIKQKVDNYEVMKEMIDEVTSNEIVNLIEKQSDILLENPDYDLTIILEPFELTQEEKDEIIQNIRDVTEYKREFRKEVQNDIEFFIELNNAVKKAEQTQ